MATPPFVSEPVSVNASESGTVIVPLQNLASNVLASLELPEHLREKIEKSIKDKVLTNLEDARSLSLLVAGRSGVGKSTIINGILGMKTGDDEFAVESSDLSQGGTRCVEPFRKRVGQIDVTVWDTRGLLDGDKRHVQDRCLDEMAQKCSGVDLNLFCIPMNQTRFTCSPENLDVIAMLKIDQAFGEAFWSNAVVILTFANNFNALHPHYSKLNAQERAEKFAAEVDGWKGQIHKVLQEFAGISKEKAEEVKVIPAGHYGFPHLLDREYWLGHLWLDILDALPTGQAQGALLNINASRLKLPDEVKPESFGTADDITDIPIVIPDPANTSTYHKEATPLLKKVLIVAGCVGAGAGAGGAVGSTAALAGPIGIAIGVPAGLLLGACVGLALGVHKIESDKKKAQ